MLGRDLDELVFIDPFERGFERKGPWRGEDELFVGRGGANVRDGFAFTRVDYEVVFTRVLADDLSAVHGFSVAQEEYAALLEGEEGVGGGFTVFTGDERTVTAARQFSNKFPVVIEHGVQNACTARIGHELVSK